ncbi:PTS system N-acetylmuramic acid-specific EIIBC component, partial [Vibrio parahaemolyticus VPTS-2010_2]
PL